MTLRDVDVPQMRCCDFLSNCTTNRIHMSFIHSISRRLFYADDRIFSMEAVKRLHNEILHKINVIFNNVVCKFKCTALLQNYKTTNLIHNSLNKNKLPKITSYANQNSIFKKARAQRTRVFF